MEKQLTLSIGADVSTYVEVENYQVRKILKESENTKDFTDANGNSVKKNYGYYYELHADLTGVPHDKMKAVTAALAQENINISFTNPYPETNDIVFHSGSTSVTAENELDDGIYWSISISLESDLISSSGSSGSDSL